MRSIVSAVEYIITNAGKTKQKQTKRKEKKHDLWAWLSRAIGVKSSIETKIDDEIQMSDFDFFSVENHLIFYSNAEPLFLCHFFKGQNYMCVRFKIQLLMVPIENERGQIRKNAGTTMKSIQRN